MDEQPERIRPSPLRRLTGEEILGPGQVVDFWRWALGDLRMNNTRGHLAEYLIARALGDTSTTRVEWGPWDVRAADGTLIEVKATGRLQSWASRQLSVPRWAFASVRSSTSWDEEIGAYEDIDPADRVHVWVFALQTAEDPGLYDPLDVDQWRFRVMPHRELLASGQISAGLPFFDQRGVRPVTLEHLAAAVSEARRRNDAWPSADSPTA